MDVAYDKFFHVAANRAWIDEEVLKEAMAHAQQMLSPIA